jgi:aminoglycoside phosphotransferase (APT) family kinase protein
VSLQSSVSPVERLFARLQLGPVRSVAPLGGGRLNTSLRVNGDLVLRYREQRRSSGSLLREAALLPRLSGLLPVPDVVASGVDDMLGEYLVQTWAPGQSMLRAWLTNPEVATREWWLEEWTAALRAIHSVRFPSPGDLPNGELRPAPSWRSYIETRVRKRLDALMRIPAMDRELVLYAEKYLRRQAPVLDDGPWCLIHRDMHFGNALVEGPRVSAILDFELAEVGPPDYELDTLYRFLRSPGDFVGAEFSGTVSPSRFASVWPRLRRGYPELFTVPRLRERLCLYALDYCFSTLLQVYTGYWGGAATENAVLDRLTEVFQGRYGPE